MASPTEKTLTERQRYWFKHIHACERSAGQRIVEHAACQCIDAKAVYRGKKSG